MYTIQYMHVWGSSTVVLSSLAAVMSNIWVKKLKVKRLPNEVSCRVVYIQMFFSQISKCICLRFPNVAVLNLKKCTSPVSNIWLGKLASQWGTLPSSRQSFCFSKQGGRTGVEYLRKWVVLMVEPTVAGDWYQWPDRLNGWIKWGISICLSFSIYKEGACSC